MKNKWSIKVFRVALFYWVENFSKRSLNLFLLGSHREAWALLAVVEAHGKIKNPSQFTFQLSPETIVSTKG